MQFFLYNMTICLEQDELIRLNIWGGGVFDIINVNMSYSLYDISKRSFWTEILKQETGRAAACFRRSNSLCLQQCSKWQTEHGRPVTIVGGAGGGSNARCRR